MESFRGVSYWLKIKKKKERYVLLGSVYLEFLVFGDIPVVFGWIVELLYIPFRIVVLFKIENYMMLIYPTSLNMHKFNAKHQSRNINDKYL